MKVKLLKDCLVSGQHCPTGEVVDVSERDGTYLVSRGHAEAASKSKAKKTTVKRQSIIVARTCLIGGEHIERGDVVKALQTDADYLIGHGDAFDPKSDEGEALAATVKKERAANKAAAAEQAEREAEALKAEADAAAEQTEREAEALKTEADAAAEKAKGAE